MEPGHAPSTAWDVDRISIGRAFIRDMERLWGEMLRMAALVEGSLQAAIGALCEVRSDLAAEVQVQEPTLHGLDIQIELDCLKMLALHQPVASDLRRVATILKVDRDLERLAVLADHISNRARKLADEGSTLPLPHELRALAYGAINQVRRSLDALTHGDTALACEVIANDRKIDRLRRSVVRTIKETIRSDPSQLDSWLRLINATRNLERVSDHASNIAEAVIFLEQGDIVRHTPRRTLGQNAQP